MIIPTLIRLPQHKNRNILRIRRNHRRNSRQLPLQATQQTKQASYLQPRPIKLTPRSLQTRFQSQIVTILRRRMTSPNALFEKRPTPITRHTKRMRHAKSSQQRLQRHTITPRLYTPLHHIKHTSPRNHIRQSPNQPNSPLPTRRLLTSLQARTFTRRSRLQTLLQHAHRRSFSSTISSRTNLPNTRISTIR